MPATPQLFQKRSWLLLLTAACMLSITVMSLVLSPISAKAESQAGWYEDLSGYRQATTLQKQSHKPLFIYFYLPYCGGCKYYEKKLLNNSKVQAYLSKSFIPVRVYPEKGQPNWELVHYFDGYGDHAFPMVMLLAPDGKKFQKLDAKLNLADMSPAEYIQTVEEYKATLK